MSYHSHSDKEQEMVRHSSAIRQWRRSLRRKAVNKSSKSALRTRIKNLRDAVKNNDRENALKLLPEVFSSIDKTVKKGTIHKNTGARYKSRLSRQVELIAPAPSK
jgi:small subunit ribosomal protein S20